MAALSTVQSNIPKNRPYSVLAIRFQDVAKMVDTIFQQVKEEFGVEVLESDLVGHRDDLTVQDQIVKVQQFLEEFAAPNEDSTISPAIQVKFSKGLHVLLVRENFCLVAEAAIFNPSNYHEGRPRIKRIEFGFYAGL